MVRSLRRFVYFVFLKIALLILGAVSCTPTRAPVPPGAIPEPGELTREERSYGERVAQQLTSQFPKETNPSILARVNSIVDQLNHSLGSDWNVYVLRDDNMVNAAASRGNNIFVWTGMLREVQNDGELAVVISHEMSHVLAEHVIPTQAEQANRLIAGLSATAARAATARSSMAQVAGLAQALVGQTVSGLIVYPEAQRIEIEADIIGLHLLAESGINPIYAIDFWQRAAERQRAGRLSQFLSTHPSSEARLEQLHQNLASASQRYRQAIAEGRRFTQAERPW
jgi:predicted Zn-dependent protease